MNVGPYIEAFGWTVPWAFMLGVLGGFIYVVVLLRRLVRVGEAILGSLQERSQA